MDRNFFNHFGGKPKKEWIKEYEKSPHWIKGHFRNLERTKLTIHPKDFPRVTYRMLSGKQAREPREKLPVLGFDMETFMKPDSNAKFIWYGHSVVVMRLQGKNILIDPMFGGDTTPIAPMASHRFSKGTLAIIDELPDIDLILLTHDHYDHLDYDSIQKLKSKCKQFYVALGVKRHLEAWGVAVEKVKEFDWWDEIDFAGIHICFTPTQHFSGRGLRDRQMTLWGGWSLRTPNENIWFSGDGGYRNHFTTIGEQLGPFDFAFMECGQYNEDWRPVHLFPDESVQAALDARVRKAMPVHWAGFNLSYFHKWHEPAEAFVLAAEAANLDYVLPKLGEVFTVAGESKDKWWEAYI